MISMHFPHRHRHKFLHNRQVRGDPLETKDFIPAQFHPAQLIMVFQRFGSSLRHLAQPDAHGGVCAQGPTVRRRAQQFCAKDSLDTEFFGEFPVQGLLVAFTGFDLAAREFPQAGKFRRGRPSGCQEFFGLRQGIQERCSHNLFWCRHLASLGRTRLERAFQRPSGGVLKRRKHRPLRPGGNPL